MSNEVPSHYWKQLLALTTAAGDQSKYPEEPRLLDEENRKWLENVMKDLVKDTDPSVQLENVMKSLHCYAANTADISKEDLNKIEDLADRLEDLVSYDFLTPQFINNGGLLMLQQFLENHCISVQCKFAQIILTFTENNAPAQKGIIECGLLNYILDFLKKETTPDNEKLKLKYLGSVSGTVRSNEAAFNQFSQSDGHNILVNLVEVDESMKITGKAARVLTSIAFTLGDSDKSTSLLYPLVLKCYNILKVKSNDEHANEIDDYLKMYNRSDVSSSQ